MTASDVINPATEELLRTVEQTDEAGVDDAVARAKAAQRDWARLAPAERAAALRAFAAVVDAHVDELAALEVANSGHPIGNAQWEAGHVRDVLQYYSATPERLSGKQIPVAGGLDVTFNEPLGVVGVITPWNFPMTIASWGFAPALAAGQRGAGQAGRVDTADDHPARRARGRGRAAARPVSGVARQGFGGGGALRHPPRCPQDRVHRIHRGRHAGDGRRGRTGQAGHSGTGRKERQHRVRRLRPGEGGSDRAVRRVRQRRSGLLRTQPNPGAAQRLRPVHGAARTGRQGRRGRRPEVEGHRDGPAGVEAALAHSGVLRARRRAGRVPWRCAVGRRATGSRRPC